MTNRLKQERILAVILCILVIIPSLFFLTRKNLFHVDEIWTYALSNSTEGPYLYLWGSGIGDPNDQEMINSEDYSYSGTDSGYFLKWHSGDEYNRYLTVQKEERFDYSNVFYNQSCDVHPPLYYLLIHTICSFFPNRFSKWFTAIPNLIFMAGCAYFLFRLTLQLGLKRERAVLVVLLWGCSRAGISDAVFLRMYMMLTFWALLSMYTHTKLLVDPGKHILLLFFCQFGRLFDPVLLLRVLLFPNAYHLHCICAQTEIHTDGILRTFRVERCCRRHHDVSRNHPACFSRRIYGDQQNWR